MLAQQTLYIQAGAASLNIDETVTRIFIEVDTLESRRRYLFVEWLITHCGMTHGKDLHRELTAWLSGMPQEEAGWQRRIILTEVDWWQEQDEATVERLLREHFGRRRS